MISENTGRVRGGGDREEKAQEKVCYQASYKPGQTTDLRVIPPEGTDTLTPVSHWLRAPIGGYANSLTFLLQKGCKCCQLEVGLACMGMSGAEGLWVGALPEGYYGKYLLNGSIDI